MTQNDINRLFTETVNSYIAQGYQINVGTMGGSQGEIAKVDLIKGDDLIRVLLEDQHIGYEYYNDIFSIAVGRYSGKAFEYWRDIIWNQRLEILARIVLVKIANNHFVTPKEAKEINEKHKARWRLNDMTDVENRLLNDSYKPIVLSYLRRQPQMKTCALKDISYIIKTTDPYGRAAYEITARGKRFSLRGRTVRRIAV